VAARGKPRGQTSRGHVLHPHVVDMNIMHFDMTPNLHAAVILCEAAGQAKVDALSNGACDATEK